MRGARTTYPRRPLRALALATFAALAGLTGASPASASLSGPIAAPPAKLNQVSLTSARICSTMQLTFFQDAPGPVYRLALFDGDTQLTPRTTSFCTTVSGLTPGTTYTLTLKGTLDSSPDAPLATSFGNVTFTTAVDAEVKELTASSATVCVPPAMQTRGFMMRQVVFDDRPVESRTVLGDSAGDCQTVTGLTAGTTYRVGLATGLPGQPESELVVGAEANFTTPSAALVAVSSITASSARVCQTGFLLAIVRRTVLFDGSVPLGESTGGCVTATGLRPETSYTLSLRFADAGAPDSELVEIGSVSFTTDRGYVTVTEVGPTSAKLCMPEDARLALNAPWAAEENGPQFFGTTAACAVATGLTPDRRYDAMIVDASKQMIGAVSIRTTKDPSFVLATATNITTDSVTICAEGRRPASENWYVVNEPIDGIQVERSAGGDRCQTVSGLMPGKDYVFAFFHGDTGEEALDFETVVRFRTLDGPPPPTTFGYTLTGAATIKTLVKGSLPLRGDLDAVTFDTESSAFSGDLFLEKSTGKLTALGFLPITAELLILPTAPLIGTLEDGLLSAVQKARIKIPKVTLFGLVLASGENCQAKQVSSITLKSMAPPFVPATGGALAGSFAISDLAGCGALTGLISPLTAGKGNAITLNLTPKP